MPWLRRPGRLLALAGLTVGVLRLAAVFGIGALRHPLNFDEGAYFGAAALWARGAVLHVDVVAVHPPVATYLLAPLTLIGAPTTGFALARGLMAIVGAVCAWLVGRVAMRFTSEWVAAAATLAYALAPDAALAEQSIVLEPLLNLACLLALVAWVSPDEPSDRRVAGAGALLAVAALVKPWGVFLVIPMILTLPAARRGRTIAVLAGSACVAAAALAAPIALRAPSEFFEQVVRFQATRADGYGFGALERLLRVLSDPRELSLDRNVFATLVLIGLIPAVAARTPMPRSARCSVLWLLTLVVVFVSAPLHFSQYNAHLAPAVCITGAWLVGGATQRWGAMGPAWRRGVVAAAVVTAIAATSAARLVLDQATDTTGDPSALASTVRTLPECVSSFEAGWLIIADRLPDPDTVGPSAADPYVTALIAANRAGERAQGLGSPAARAATRDFVERCDTVIVGERGRAHLGVEWQWFTDRYSPDSPDWDGRPDVWRRRRS